MKYKLLSVHNGDQNNIGDYVQALASSQFIPSLDGFINREELDLYNDGECKVIMNGWYMHNPEHWPPSSKIHPLFVAFHLNSSISDRLLTEEGILYLKKHEPIGCRDTNTVRLLSEKGINAYFSGCMTLTLGKNYLSKEKDDCYYFVDPTIPKSKKLTTILLNFLYLLANFSNVVVVGRKLYQGEKLSFKRKLITAGFIRLYSRIIDKNIIVNAKYICQENSSYTNSFKTDFERLNEAERLVKLYARAKFVVTSRIHCALPCLGLNTPVLYTLKANDNDISTCRFGGLIDLFNVAICSPDDVRLLDCSYNFIKNGHIPQNKQSWVELSRKLIQSCINFVKE